MIELTNYNGRESEKAICVSNLENVSFSYERGRLNIYVNHKLVYETMNAGDDFSVEINSKE